MTLDEWVEATAERRLLRDNLKTNIEVYCTDLADEDQAQLLRVHLIMVRQFAKNSEKEHAKDG